MQTDVTALQTQCGLGIFGQKMAPSDSLAQRFLWKNRKNGIFEPLFQYVNVIVQVRGHGSFDLSHVTLSNNYEKKILTFCF